MSADSISTVLSSTPERSWSLSKPSKPTCSRNGIVSGRSPDVSKMKPDCGTGSESKRASARAREQGRETHTCPSAPAAQATSQDCATTAASRMAIQMIALQPSSPPARGATARASSSLQQQRLHHPHAASSSVPSIPARIARIARVRRVAFILSGHRCNKAFCKHSKHAEGQRHKLSLWIYAYKEPSFIHRGECIRIKI